MTFVPHTEEDRSAMLSAIGKDSLEQLFEEIPSEHRFPRLDLPTPLSELELEREMLRLAASNLDPSTGLSFLGAGAYRHWIPATVDAVLRRGELYTSYTPYQPEISQGMLQAMFEYQTMICELFDMDVSTASHYDGATALAEAVLMCLAESPSSRRKIVVSPAVQPQYREVIATYLQGARAELVVASGLDIDHDRLLTELDETTAACIVQSPNFFGRFEPLDELAERIHASGARLVVVADPIACGLFRPPGDLNSDPGADLVAADGQPLGIPLSFGGPHLGILAASEAMLRRLPGRLVGETVDADGQRAYVLTLGTREQHIRREKATSNICTNSALMALAAATYLATLGKSGLCQVATQCFHRSHYAAKRLAELEGCRVEDEASGKPFFKEFVLELPCAAEPVLRALLEHHDILGGYDLSRSFPMLDRHLLVAVTETCSGSDIDRLYEALGEVLHSQQGGVA